MTCRHRSRLSAVDTQREHVVRGVFSRLTLPKSDTKIGTDWRNRGSTYCVDLTQVMRQTCRYLGIKEARDVACLSSVCTVRLVHIGQRESALVVCLHCSYGRTRYLGTYINMDTVCWCEADLRLPYARAAGMSLSYTQLCKTTPIAKANKKASVAACTRHGLESRMGIATCILSSRVITVIICLTARVHVFGRGSSADPLPRKNIFDPFDTFTSLHPASTSPRGR